LTGSPRFARFRFQARLAYGFGSHYHGLQARLAYGFDSHYHGLQARLAYGFGSHYHGLQARLAYGFGSHYHVRLSSRRMSCMDTRLTIGRPWGQK
jgi:hypothetical protein